METSVGRTANAASNHKVGVLAQARFALDLSPLDAVLNGFRLRHQASSGEVQVGLLGGRSSALPSILAAH